jgi:hypothetical protein
VATGVIEPLAGAVVVEPDTLIVIVFGRRRLGLVVGPVLFVFAEALGRVVIKEPRTSSSCCAKTCIGTKAAIAIRKPKKIIFTLI